MTSQLLEQGQWWQAQEKLTDLAEWVILSTCLFRFPSEDSALPISPAVSSCVRQGLLPPTGVVGLAVAGANVGGLGFSPLGDGAGGLPLDLMPWGTVK